MYSGMQLLSNIKYVALIIF